MKNAWQVLRGRERLKIVFWLYCVLGTAAALALLAMPYPRLPIEAMLVLTILGFGYLLWAHISLWTCAFNTPRRTWGYVARTYAFVLLAAFAALMVWPYFFTVKTAPIEVRMIQ